MIAGMASHQIIVPAWNTIEMSFLGCPLILSSDELIAHKDSAGLSRPICYLLRYIFQE